MHTRYRYEINKCKIMLVIACLHMCESSIKTPTNKQTPKNKARSINLNKWEKMAIVIKQLILDLSNAFIV